MPVIVDQAVSVPGQSADPMRSAIIGPDRGHLTAVDTAGLAVVALDRDAPEFHVALDLARPGVPWPTRATSTRKQRIDDPRSSDRTCV